MPRRRFQKGRVYQRGRTQRWVGSFRDDKIDPLTGQLKRIRRTVTFDSSVTSRRAALRALQPYLDGVNIDPLPPKRGGKTVAELVAEWKTEILPNRKPGGARACLSHLRKHIVPLLGKMTLREVNPKTIQTFVTTVGMRVDRKKTVENVYGTLSSILKKGRRWGYFIPEVKGGDVEFPASKKPPTQTFIFDADTAALVINAATMPFRYMLLVDALCYFRIGEGDALKVSDLDFTRKEVNVNAALDYATGKEGSTKTDKSCTSVPMPEMLERYLKDWLEHHYKPNPKGYLFINRKGKPYRSENVIRQGVHKAMAKLGIPRPKGVHVGVHAFRHGASSELLNLGTPINVVTRLMRHADAKTTLRNYAHLVHDSDRAASERMSQKIEQKLVQLESTPEMESTSIKTV